MKYIIAISLFLSAAAFADERISCGGCVPEGSALPPGKRCVCTYGKGGGGPGKPTPLKDGTLSKDDVTTKWNVTGAKPEPLRVREFNKTKAPLADMRFITQEPGTLSQPLARITATQFFTIYCKGMDGNVSINLDSGETKFTNCGADEAAKSFWHAVEMMAPARKCDEKK